jgi:hypothetical protein
MVSVYFKVFLVFLPFLKSQTNSQTNHRNTNSQDPNDTTCIDRIDSKSLENYS